MQVGFNMIEWENGPKWVMSKFSLSLSLSLSLPPSPSVKTAIHWHPMGPSRYRMECDKSITDISYAYDYNIYVICILTLLNLKKDQKGINSSTAIHWSLF